MFKFGTIEEFHVWSFWRFYWARKGFCPAHTRYFANLFGRLYFHKTGNNQSYRRFSDDDYIFGPLTVAKVNYKAFSLALSSANEDAEDKYCSLTGYAFGYGFRLNLPHIVKPFKVKVKADSWDEATIARLGRDWYYNYYTREYGFSIHEGHFSIRYGVQNDNGYGSKVPRRYWGCFLPWTQWRFVRHSLYNDKGEIFCHYLNKLDKKITDVYELKGKCPAVHFLIEDYDGDLIVAKTILEEREWHKGEGWFKWLSFFVKPMINTVLDIEYSHQVGRGKHSWKGGLMGHSISIKHIDNREEVFRNYCNEEHRCKEGKYRIKFIKKLELHEVDQYMPKKKVEDTCDEVAKKQ